MLNLSVKLPTTTWTTVNCYSKPEWNVPVVSHCGCEWQSKAYNCSLKAKPAHDLDDAAALNVFDYGASNLLTA